MAIGQIQAPVILDYFPCGFGPFPEFEITLAMTLACTLVRLLDSIYRY
eukprot:COSAG01_NODE_54301_length_333_cov_0.619658_1_plen_47_part_01